MQEDLFQSYEETLRAWSHAVTDGEPHEANALFDRQQSALKGLRSDSRGREAVERLMTDEDPGVRLLAAGAVLGWDSDRARKVLAELAKDEQAAPQHSFSAEITLEEFDAGRLTFG